MERIISDVYVKKDKQIWGKDPTEPFNRKILAVNNMYGWLYDQGILEKASFVFKDFKDTTNFALNVKDLLPYRKDMENCPAVDAALAVQHIFDESYSPCVYSGAIELSWTMSSYRNVDGCVGRSWECGLIKSLDTEGVYKISEIRDAQGVQAAVKALYDQFDWNLTLPEQARYQEALAHFNNEAQATIENDFVKAHARELIFCFDHGKTLIDFDFWTRYEVLCEGRLSYEEYMALDSSYDGDPHDIEEGDHDVIEKLKGVLEQYRKTGRADTFPESKTALSDQIRAAEGKAQREVPETRAKGPERGPEL